MSDIFSNLAAQNLGSRVGIQPFIPPLFAPASQLFSEVTLSASNDQPAEATENAMFSIAPSSVTEGMTDIWEEEQLSKEVMMPEKRTIHPDLVPSDVSLKATSNLSLRRLLYYQHFMRNRTESVSHPSQSPLPAPTIDVSLLEDMPSTTVAKVKSVRDDISRPLPGYQPPGEVDGVLLPQSTQSQEAILPNMGNSGTPYSSISYDDQKHTEEKLQAASTKYESQHTPPKDHPAMPTVDASHFQFPVPASDEPTVPLLIQPAFPVSSPLLQPETQSEHFINRDDALDQPSSSFVQPQVKPTSIPVPRDRFIAPLADESALKYYASKPRQQTIADDQPEVTAQSLSGFDETTIKPLLDQHIVAKEQELLQPFQVAESTSAAQPIRAQLIEPGASTELISNSSRQDVQHSQRDYSMEEAHSAKTEGEVPTINITIGRVVVRATPTTQPAPTQNRVLRPAQSLNAYLKQRERGSR